MLNRNLFLQLSNLTFMRRTWYKCKYTIVGSDIYFIVIILRSVKVFDWWQWRLQSNIEARDVQLVTERIWRRLASRASPYSWPIAGQTCCLGSCGKISTGEASRYTNHWEYSRSLHLKEGACINCLKRRKAFCTYKRMVFSVYRVKYIMLGMTLVRLLSNIKKV